MNNPTCAVPAPSPGTSPVRAGGFAFATDTRLSDLACRVGQLLAMLARGDRVTHKTATLAARLGRGVRAVQLALAELIRCGYVRREWSNALSSRRALVLLWRGAKGLVQLALPFGRADEPPPPTAQSDCALTAQSRCAVPPHPPYKDWGVMEELPDDDTAAATNRPPAPAPAPVESSSSGRVSPRDPERGGSRDEDEDPETAAAVAKAVEAFGADHAGRARALARTFGPVAVRLAVAEVAPKRRQLDRPWGYVVSICRNWREEHPGTGHPPEAPARARRVAQTPEERAAWVAQAAEVVAGWFR